MRQIILHWVEMRTLKVPKNTPKYIDEVFLWMEKKGGIDNFTIKSDTRDLEIVSDETL